MGDRSDPADAPSSVPASDGFPVRFPRDRELLEGRLLRRYKRFLADVELASGATVTVHCANTGAMEGLTRPGSRVWIARAVNPKRKLPWDLELVQPPEEAGEEMAARLFGAHTGVPNRLVRRLLEAGLLGWLGPFDELAPEKRYGEGSRIDFWLCSEERGEVFIEVKNCHLVYPDRRAYFPDAVSDRAAKHLEELGAMVEKGHRAEVLFVCQTGPVDAVRPSDVHDPRFAATARRVADAGVGFSALAVTNTPDEIVVEGPVPVDLEPYPTGEIEIFRNRLRGTS